ncbi:acyl-CoA dehydrogenase family protein [Reyranella sp.]|jgi:alkylation response protein AidB-like acyl-CoA dehydrogenase|uniref:acyl-CoA dehydrogenase family protein n=1 Tax=Reyranella sp. TaxID=1929291 RepID=UPI00273145E4|nr:acyl-CoA dehydrogenase family protein [Reyranella sp.]MDP2375022.1 acyl-CoA dehydrogenase family protein [Reyranella sp.]
MDLTLTEHHRALYDEVNIFIARHRDRAPRPGGGRKQPDRKMLDWQAQLLERGYFARTIPRDYGGFGAEPNVIELAIIADAFNRAGVSPGIHNQGISMLVPTLLEVGTEEQKRRWIGPTIRGETIWCQGYSEPGSGSDLAAAQTRAVVENGQFVINGQKIWTSSAHYADMMFLLCRTEPDMPKHAGLSYLLLPMSTPGIEVRPLRTMTGRAEFNETFFTDVRVPTDQIVMGRGDGWHVANVTLKYERMLLGDPNKLQQRLETIRRMMEEAGLDGVRLLDRAEWRDRLLRLQGEVMAARYHNLRLLTEQAEGVDSGLGRLIVKYHGTMLAHRLASLAVDVLGSAGLAYEPQGEMAEDDPATTWHIDYMYDIGLIIGGGSSNIQKNIIGERGLGLPREPKAMVLVTAGRS